MISDLESLNTRLYVDNEKALVHHTCPYEACKSSHAISVITEWDEFCDYNWKKIYDSSIKPAKVFDGRNVLNMENLRKIGFEVYSIGKS